MSGYSNYDGYSYSEVRRYEEERSKINIALWPDQLGSNESRNPVCEYDPHIKLQLIENGTTWFCRECGNKTPTSEIKQERKLVRKHGARTNSSMLTTLKGDMAKRRPKSSRELAETSGVSNNDSLDAETKSELRGWGFNV